LEKKFYKTTGRILVISDQWFGADINLLGAENSYQNRTGWASSPCLGRTHN